MPNTADHCGDLTPTPNPAAAHAARPASGRVRRGLLALGLATLLATTTGCVERLFFQPDQQVYTTPAQFGLSAQDLYFNAPDGSRLHGWWLPAQLAPGAQAKGTVLHLHGNAANVSNHLPAVAWLPAQGWHVLTFDYRGFGQSQGRPTLDGVVEDAQAALNALRQQPGVDPKRIVVFGQSLGGATALRLLAQDSTGVVGAVIDSAFASYRGIAREAAARSALLGAVAPAGVKLLPGPEKDPVTAAAKVSVPTLLIHGTADRIVDYQNSYQLAVALNALSPPDRLPEVLELRDGQHIDAMRRPEIRGHVLGMINGWVGVVVPSQPVFVPEILLTPPEPGIIQRGPPPAPGPKPAPPTT